MASNQNRGEEASIFGGEAESHELFCFPLTPTAEVVLGPKFIPMIPPPAKKRRRRPPRKKSN